MKLQFEKSLLFLRMFLLALIRRRPNFRPSYHHHPSPPPDWSKGRGRKPSHCRDRLYFPGHARELVKAIERRLNRRDPAKAFSGVAAGKPVNVIIPDDCAI